MAQSEDARRGADETGDHPRNVPYTCYISACPEDRNVGFKHPEFLVCYRVPTNEDTSSSSLDETSVAKYYCYPVTIRPIYEENSDTVNIEIRALTSEPSLGSPRNSQHSTGTTGSNHNHNHCEDTPYFTSAQQQAQYCFHNVYSTHAMNHGYPNLVYQRCTNIHCPHNMFAHPFSGANAAGAAAFPNGAMNGTLFYHILDGKLYFCNL